MRKEKIYGYCSLCDKYGELTFAHIHPKCCDNNKRVFALNYDDILKNEGFFKKNKKPKGKYVIQKGFGFYSLCEKCNNYSGLNYDNSFKVFYKQGLEAYNSNSKEVNLHCKNIYPLRIIKEILMMFVIINHSYKFSTDLKRFLMNKDNQEFPEMYKIYCYLTEDIFSLGFFQKAQRNSAGKMIFLNYSLVSYKPFGFILADVSKQNSELNKICNLVSFSKYKFSDQENLKLPLRVYNNPDSLYSPAEYMNYTINVFS